MNRREAGRLGGLATAAKYGSRHMSEIGKLGGRPSIEELVRRAGESQQKEDELGRDAPAWTYREDAE